jgi:hypothetical protein
VRTLAQLRTATVLSPERRVKVSRAEVRGLILQSLLWYPVPSRWRGLFGPGDAR